MGIQPQKLFTDNYTEPDTTYSYKLVTIDTSGNESTGEVYTITTEALPIPSKPFNLRVSPTYNSITIMWNKVKHAQSYKVYRVKTTEEQLAIDSKHLIASSSFFLVADGHDLELLGETEQNNFSVDELEGNQTYTFMVSAVNSSGESEYASVTASTVIFQFEAENLGISPWEIVYNAIILVGALGQIILLSLSFYFAPRLIAIIKEASS